MELPPDFVVLASVRGPATGEVQSVIYSFADDEADVLPVALPEDTRWHLGLAAPWTKERTFDLIQRAPSGEWGVVHVCEVRNLALTRDEGLVLFAGGREVGRLVNVAQREHFLDLPEAEVQRRLGHIGGGRGARALTDGEGLVYRLIKDRPSVRDGRSSTTSR